MPVIMEGVETQEQTRFLYKIGCNYVQGYYYARPMPAKQTEQFLSEHVSAAAGAGRHTTA